MQVTQFGGIRVNDTEGLVQLVLLFPEESGAVPFCLQSASSPIDGTNSLQLDTGSTGRSGVAFCAEISGNSVGSDRR